MVPVEVVELVLRLLLQLWQKVAVEGVVVRTSTTCSMLLMLVLR
jgi:hypothetical protein